MITVQTIIDKLIEPVGVMERTTDRLIAGRPEKKVSRVAVTFSSSYDSIEAAVDMQADLLITHEPTFYNHHDESDWLAGDEVFEKKRKLIEESGIAIYRFHDYWHRYRPDGILSGFLDTMGWEPYARSEAPHLFDLPQTKIRHIVERLKEKLGDPTVELFGGLEQEVSVVGLSLGMEGGRRQIGKLKRGQADLLIVGETNSWETNEYVQDAVAMGLAKSMIILGHLPSEEAGMRHVVPLLEGLFPEVQAHFIAGVSRSRWL